MQNLEFADSTVAFRLLTALKHMLVLPLTILKMNKKM
jgi:hypothetical protein